MYHKLLMINQMNLPTDITLKIQIEYKYNMLEIKYRKDYRILNKFFNYHFFLLCPCC